LKNGDCRCEACGHRFSGMTAFDMHGTGGYTGRHSRRRLSSREMRAKGMQRSAKGVWNSGQFQRRVEQLEMWPKIA
jgi:hypothetical protein